MTFYLENAEEFWSIDYQDDIVTVRSGSLGEAGAVIETHEVAGEDEALEMMRARARAQRDRGFVQRLPPEERFSQDERVKAYWQHEVLDVWKAMGVSEADPIPYRDRWEAYLAKPLPEELDQYLTWRSSHRFGYCNFGEWRMWDEDLWLPEPEGGNLFEQLVLMDQENVLATAMMGQFARWVSIGSAGNGDQYFAHVDDLDPQRVEVVFYDHETSSPSFVCADSLSSFAWLNRCYVAFFDNEDAEDEAPGLAQITEDMSRLEGRVALSWHFDELEEATEFEPGYEAKSDALYLFHKFVWISDLLRNNSIGAFEELAEVFYEGLHAELNFEQAKTRPFDASSALYWIWRLFWFDKPELEECLELVASHDSPVVRDCVALVREFLEGRTELGTIEDIFALRERFLALDLDPDRAEERAREAEEAERLAKAAHHAAMERADQLIAEDDVDAMKEALWELDDDEATERVFARVVEASPEGEVWARRWNFIDEHRSSRDGRGHDYEDEELYEIIWREPSDLIGPLLGNPESWTGHDWKRLGLAAAAAGPRMLPHLLAALDTRDEYRRAQTAAARGFAALGDPAHVGKLVPLVKELWWPSGNFFMGMSKSDALLATIEALGALGGSEAVEVLMKLMEKGPDKVRPRAAVSLGRIGDAAATQTLIAYVDSEATRPVLFALAHIGTEEARSAIDAYIAKNAGSLLNLAYEHGMQQFAAFQTGGADAVDWSLVAELNLIVENSTYDDRELHETLARLFRHHPDAAVAEARLREYLHHEYAVVRTAAIEELEALGVDLTLRWMDRPTVELIWESRGVEGLREALADPNAIFRHNLVIKAAEEDVGDALDAEVLALADLYCRFTGYTNGYVRDAHRRTYYLIEAMSKLDTEATLRRLCRLWKSSNPHYRGAEYIKHDFDDLHARMMPYVAEVEAALAAEAEAKANAEAKKEGLGLSARPFGTSAHAEGHTSRIRSVQILGDQVLTSSDDKSVIRWSRDGTLLAKYAFKDGLRDAVMDDEHVYAISGEFAACRTLDGEEVWQREGVFDYWIALMGDRFISPPYDTLRILDRHTGEDIYTSKTLFGLQRMVRLDDDHFLVAKYQGERLLVVNPFTLKVTAQWKLPPVSGYGGLWSMTAADGEVFVSRRDESVVVFDAHGEVIRRGVFDKSLYTIRVVGDHLVSASSGTTVKVFDKHTFELIQEVETGIVIEAFGVGPGPTIVVGGKNGELVMVDVAS